MLWIVVGMLQIFGRSLMYPNHKEKKDISGAFWDGWIDYWTMGYCNFYKNSFIMWCQIKS